MGRWIASLAAAAIALVAAPALAPGARATPIDLLAELRARAVTERTPPPQELWTWTSIEQATALDRGAPLLSARAGDGALRAPYQLALDALGTRDDATGAIARMLTERARRYAWSTPYGTAIALGPRQYGAALLRITLRDDVIHLRLVPDDPLPLRAIDGRGAPLPLEAALARPDRIATVHHAQPRAAGGGFREIVIVGGISGWSLDRGERIAEDRRVLVAMRSARRSARTHLPRALAPLWADALAVDPLALFAQTMPFDTPRHRPTDRALADLARALSRR